MKRCDEITGKIDPSDRESCWSTGRPTQQVVAPEKVRDVPERALNRRDKGRMKQLTGMLEEYGRRADLNFEEPLQPISGEPREADPCSEESPEAVESCVDCAEQSSHQINRWRQINSLLR